ASLLLAGCGTRSSDKLIVGMELVYPPFEMTDTEGRPTGVSVDLAHALGKYLGKEIEIQNMPFDGLIAPLKTRKIYLILSPMTAASDRAQSLVFSEPYLKKGLCLPVGKNSSIQPIRDFDQPGKVVVTKLGTTGHLYATRNIKRAQVRVLEQESMCVLEVV